MTPDDRLFTELPSILVDLADERMPDYVHDLLGRSAASSQRPAWTFPGRWIPMAELVAERRFVPRLPWRILAVAALLALLVAGAVWFAGSRHRVPAPFGPAANGSIVYATGGDLFLGNPTSGESRLLLGGVERDTSPLVSPDGQTVAFLRGPSRPFNLMAVRIDGGTPVRISDVPLNDGITFEWAPDSRSLILPYANGDLVRVDASGGSPVVIAHGVDVDIHALRPPGGGEILFQYHGSPLGLFAMHPDGTGVRTILPAVGDEINGARWSPDGSRIVFARKSADDEQRLFVAAADGSGVTPLTSDPRAWVETDFAWSPDGTRVAFDRWLQDPATGSWNVQPVAVVTVASHELREVGSVPVSEGSLFQWSPDGQSLLALPGPHAAYGSAATDRPVVVDVATGTERPLGWAVETAVSWQRAAP
jgi:WD40 repeat protein